MWVFLCLFFTNLLFVNISYEYMFIWILLGCLTCVFMVFVCIVFTLLSYAFSYVLCVF